MNVFDCLCFFLSLVLCFFGLVFGRLWLVCVRGIMCEMKFGRKFSPFFVYKWFGTIITNYLIKKPYITNTHTERTHIAHSLTRSHHTYSINDGDVWRFPFPIYGKWMANGNGTLGNSACVTKRHEKNCLTCCCWLLLMIFINIYINFVVYFVCLSSFECCVRARVSKMILTKTRSTEMKFIR